MNRGEEAGMEVFRASSDDFQSNVIFTKFLNISSQGVEDMGDPITMRFIQCSIQSNPDEICKALDDPLIGKDGTEDSEPWASGCK
jgi:hypothetical protein